MATDAHPLEPIHYMFIVALGTALVAAVFGLFWSRFAMRGRVEMAKVNAAAVVMAAVTTIGQGFIYAQHPDLVLGDGFYVRLAMGPVAILVSGYGIYIAGQPRAGFVDFKRYKLLMPLVCGVLAGTYFLDFLDGLDWGVWLFAGFNAAWWMLAGVNALDAFNRSDRKAKVMKDEVLGVWQPPPERGSPSEPASEPAAYSRVYKPPDATASRDAAMSRDLAASRDPAASRAAAEDNTDVEMQKQAAPAAAEAAAPAPQANGEAVANGTSSASASESRAKPQRTKTASSLAVPSNNLPATDDINVLNQAKQNGSL